MAGRGEAGGGGGAVEGEGEHHREKKAEGILQGEDPE